jgi:hypothetical protein
VLEHLQNSNSSNTFLVENRARTNAFTNNSYTND